MSVESGRETFINGFGKFALPKPTPWRKRILFDVNWIEGNLSLSVLVSREDDLVGVD